MYRVLRLLSSKARLLGIQVIFTLTVFDDGEKVILKEKVERALSLIKETLPLFFNNMESDITAILLINSQGSRGKYIESCRFIQLDSDNIIDPKTSCESLSRIIVHEAQHARLSSLGFGYEEVLRARIERVCIRAERKFVSKLANNDDALGQVNARISRVFDLDYRDRLNTSSSLERLRFEHRLPLWLIRVIKVYANFREKRRINHNMGYIQLLEKQYEGLLLAIQDAIIKRLDSSGEEKKIVIEKELDDLQYNLRYLESGYQRFRSHLHDQNIQIQALRGHISVKEVTEAQEAIAHGDLSKAKAIYLNVSQFDSTTLNAKAAYNLGEMAVQHFDRTEAFEFFKTAVQLDPTNCWYLEVFSETANYLGRSDIVIHYIEKALSNSTEPPMVIANLESKLAVAYQIKGEHRKTVKILEKVLKFYFEIYSESEWFIQKIFNDLGISYFELGDWDNALYYYKRNLNGNLKRFGKNHSNASICWANIGEVWEEKEEHAKAIHYYQLALNNAIKVLGTDNPRVSYLHNCLGRSFLNLEKVDSALKHYQDSLDIELKNNGPDHPNVSDRKSNIRIALLKQENADGI